MVKKKLLKFNFEIRKLFILGGYLCFFFVWAFSLKAEEELLNLWYFGQQWCNIHSTIDLKVFYDPEISSEQLKNNYKKFDFDYTSKENPLLEKELFKMLGQELVAKGMVRDKESPDILITMNYYIGKREKYIPPQTITSSRVDYVWTTGMIGWTPTGQMQPVTQIETKTIPGKTEVSYYRNIRLNFLDYKVLKSGEKPQLPPLLWIGEVESEGSTNDLRGVAPMLFRELLREYPKRSEFPKDRRIYIKCVTYGDIGARVLKNDWRIIKKVVPGSPAEKAGLKPKDKILKINGRYQGNGYYSCYKYRSREYCLNKDQFYNQIVRNTQGKEVKLTVRSPDEKKPRVVSIIPEVKNICGYHIGEGGTLLASPEWNAGQVNPEWVKTFLYYIKK